MNKLIKEEIMDLINGTRERLFICTYSSNFTSVDFFQIIKAIEIGCVIDILIGKELPEKVLSKFRKLFNVRIYYSNKNHSKIFLNESSAIITSCNFGKLNKQELIECGIRFNKREYVTQYRDLESQVREIISSAEIIMPILPFRPEKKIDLRDFLS